MRGHCSVVSGLPCSAADHWFPGCSLATGGKQGTGQSTLNIEALLIGHREHYKCDPSIYISIIYGGQLFSIAIHREGRSLCSR